jgi:hypothetical protein
MDFKSKYLKYKEKYLNLKKNQMGGNAEQPSAAAAVAAPTPQENAIKAEAIALYAALDRSRRAALYARVMANPAFPFHDGPDVSHEGRWFIIATGDYPAPAAQVGLNRIVEQLFPDQVRRAIAYRVYRDELHALAAGAAAPGAAVAAAPGAAAAAPGAAAAAPAPALVIPPRGDFSFIPADVMDERGMLRDAFTAVESVPGGWAALMPEPAGRGFMFSARPAGSVLAQIDAAIAATPSGNNHSGSTYGWTMRQMQGIARLGWPAYVTLRLNRMAAAAAHAPPHGHAHHHGHAPHPGHAHHPGHHHGYAAAAGPVVGAVAVFSVRDGQDTICPICFEPLQLAAGNVRVVSDATQDGTEAHPVRCGHKFHRDCINGWLAKHHTCPMCRGNVSRTDPSSRM